MATSGSTYYEDPNLKYKREGWFKRKFRFLKGYFKQLWAALTNNIDYYE